MFGRAVGAIRNICVLGRERVIGLSQEGEVEVIGIGYECGDGYATGYVDAFAAGRGG